METFNRSDLKSLYQPAHDSNGEDNGQVTIIGGSRLFHGAPLFSLKIASRIVDMVFFSSPEESIGRVAEKIKASLASFIWVPFNEIEKYIEKSDCILIGPGLMRFGSEFNNRKLESGNPGSKALGLDSDGETTRKITKKLLFDFPRKKWVIDAGSLQTIDSAWIPQGAILTPNKKEFEILFDTECQIEKGRPTPETIEKARSISRSLLCTIILKAPEAVVISPDRVVAVSGGNAGLTKGGSGDVLAGLVAALYSKNEAFLSASAATFLLKACADDLFEKKGTFFNSDDLAEKLTETLHRMIS